MAEPSNLQNEVYKSILRTRKKKKAICSKYIDAIVELEKKRLSTMKIRENPKPKPISLPQFPKDDYDDKEMERTIRAVVQEMKEILVINKIIKKDYSRTSMCYIPHTMVTLDGETI